jgi:Fe-S-cluster containining protein
VTTFWLSTHLGYACRHSGACCTARWPIPIERDRVAGVQRAIDDGAVRAPLDWYHPTPGPSDEVAGVLSRQATGACVFHQPATPGAAAGGRCAIHPLRPAACVHFPYVCVLDPRGVHVTLSHFCPTAASQLFEPREVRVVEGPSVFGQGPLPDGLDAREALPPAAENGARLLSWDELTVWETEIVTRLASARPVPQPPSPEDFDRARAALIPGWTWPSAPSGLDGLWATRVAPAWLAWAPVIGRYLAARAHASWAMYLGSGPRDVERMVDLARTVLQVEAVRACAAHDASLNRTALTEAIRQSDLLLVHLTDPTRLVAA